MPEPQLANKEFNTEMTPFCVPVKAYIENYFSNVILFKKDRFVNVFKRCEIYETGILLRIK